MERTAGLPRKNIDRREFLKLAALGARYAALAGLAFLGMKSDLIRSYLREKVSGQSRELSKSLNEREIEYSEFDNIPDKLRGFSVNMAKFCHVPEENWDYYIDQTRKLKAGRIRLMIGDEFQPDAFQIFLDDKGRDTSYREGVLDRVARFSKQIKNVSQGSPEPTGLEVDFFDCYQLGNGDLVDNPVYGKSGEYSPYNLTRDRDGYRHFFVDPKMRQVYKDRMKKIVEGLRSRGVDNIDCWSVINEAKPELIGEDGVDIMTDWYGEMVSYLRKDLKVEEPIVTGLANPWNIRYQEVEGLTANTMHIYLPEIDPIKLESYISNHREALIVQEFGVPYALFGQPLPKWLYNAALLRMTDRILKASIKEKFENGARKLVARVSSFSAWEIGPNEDSFSVDDDYRPAEVTELFLSMNKLRRYTPV